MHPTVTRSLAPNAVEGMIHGAAAKPAAAAEVFLSTSRRVNREESAIWVILLQGTTSEAFDIELTECRVVVPSAGRCRTPVDGAVVNRLAGVLGFARALLRSSRTPVAGPYA